MANNRLYIINEEEKTYLAIQKQYELWEISPLGAYMMNLFMHDMTYASVFGKFNFKLVDESFNLKEYEEVEGMEYYKENMDKLNGVEWDDIIKMIK